MFNRTWRLNESEFATKILKSLWKHGKIKENAFLSRITSSRSERELLPSNSVGNDVEERVYKRKNTSNAKQKIVKLTLMFNGTTSEVFRNSNL